mgnify:CR=1 FL=1
MFESAGKYKIAAMLAPVGLVIGLSAGVAQAEDKPVWTGKAGGVVTRYGECWQGKGGTMAENCMSDKDSDGDGVFDTFLRDGIATKRNYCCFYIGHLISSAVISSWKIYQP